MSADVFTRVPDRPLPRRGLLHLYRDEGRIPPRRVRETFTVMNQGLTWGDERV